MSLHSNPTILKFCWGCGLDYRPYGCLKLYANGPEGSQVNPVASQANFGQQVDISRDLCEYFGLGDFHADNQCANARPGSSQPQEQSSVGLPILPAKGSIQPISVGCVEGQSDQSKPKRVRKPKQVKRTDDVRVEQPVVEQRTGEGEPI